MSYDRINPQVRFRRILLATSLLSTILLPGVASAQDVAADETAAEAPTDIIVTGSRLQRTDLTAPSPITVVGQEDVQLSGNLTLEKTMNEFPQLASGNTSTVNNGGGAGVLTANLRGLGETRTLTLVNGRRFIPANSNGSVDLTSIPDALIKRVEVITGGASAVYGSDAIAGAVNFILDDSFEGLQMSAQAGISDRGDAASKKIDITFGADLGGGRGNVAISGAWAKQDPITQADRPFGRVPLAEINGQLVYSGSGNIPGTRVPLSQAQRNALVGVNLTPSGPCTSITGIRFGAGGTPLPYCQPEDTYNYAPFNLLQRPLERINFSALAHYDVTDHITAYAEAFFVNARNNSKLAPDSFTPVTPGAASSTLLVPNYATSASLSPAVRDFFINNRALFDADGDGTAAVVGGGRRADELGTRDSFFERQSYAITTGLRGDFDVGKHSWRWDAFYQYLRNRTDTRAEGVINQTRLSLGLDSIVNGSGQVVCRSGVPGCVPVSIFGLGSISPQAGVYLTPPRTSHDIFERQVAGASLSGTLFDLPAGPVAVAVGVEYRKDSYQSTPSAMDLNKEYGAASNNALAGSFDVKEIFGEIRIPILSDTPFFDTLAIEGAARYSDYSTVGGVFTWKAGGEWAPVSWVRIRGAYNSAIRAPNINELFSAVGQGFTGGTDPCARPNLTGTDPRSQQLRDFCVAQGVPAGDIATFTQATLGLTQETGGNPNLTEEKSKTYTIGAVISPPFIPRLNITVDYFNVEVKGAITTINAQQTLNDCYTGLNANSPTCRSVFRLSSGQIDYVRTNQNNIGALKVRGLDVQGDYTIPLPAALGDDAQLRLTGVASWLFERSTQVLSTVAPQDCAGFYGAGCSTGTGGFIVPDFKLNLGAAYTSGPLSIRGQARMIGGLKVFPTVTTTNIKTAPATWYFDLTSTFEINDNFTFFAGVDNLLDKMPPILGTTFVGDANVDVSLYDTLGRRYFAGVRMKF
ncbi:TonB-dependent receptor [Sphingopyxis sp. H038]|jgi:iron complex outermembrane receptor protein|uniref:TonB-dependent receptor domain-containing protein n=1 Tax=unclassified Sphingopyxis TaxID=2614943 RepID=UPI000730A31A|nr:MULTISPECIES: TonB-dependent receptor [unclassified Sphingopyxis]KTE02418.1 TonB-dependent receptor [Sphingopyxis sp. H012]KTE09597.1 TonB-dependent receptor [Sphingopyxis sp. H093]KTE10979.1 TonB-dependent receptor [Sphingopyxis sp. H053]KTE26035.1 TonB-dependent receptor [Sphingopyxis sp. H080]KTE35467.1 TonB-dependent receptor [Sphingopyxis sp. H038]